MASEPSTSEIKLVNSVFLDNGLYNIANAIRNQSAAVNNPLLLKFPNDFVTAINNIDTKSIINVGFNSLDTQHRICYIDPYNGFQNATETIADGYTYWNGSVVKDSLVCVLWPAGPGSSLYNVSNLVLESSIILGGDFHNIEYKQIDFYRATDEEISM